MRMPTLTAALIGAGLCMLPVSFHWSNGAGEANFVAVATANAAELTVPPYQRGSRRGYRRNYRTAHTILSVVGPTSGADGTAGAIMADLGWICAATVCSRRARH